MNNFYPVINVEAENEHFQICDLLLSWIEQQKCSDQDKAPNSISYSLSEFLPSSISDHQLTAPGIAWNLVRIFNQKRGHSFEVSLSNNVDLSTQSFLYSLNEELVSSRHRRVESPNESLNDSDNESNHVLIRGDEEWAPPRPQIIFDIPKANFRRNMIQQNYRCAGCGTKIDEGLARRSVLYCHYLGKYFCKCCFSHKAIHLPGYILQKWDFHKYPVSHFALQLLDRLANEPLFNINDVNTSLYKKVKKLRNLVDVRTQLYYLQIYISTCSEAEKLYSEYTSFAHQHLLQSDVHLYSLNNLIELQHGKLFEYLYDLVVRSVSHIADCDKCRAKGHYCQLCGPSSLMSNIILGSSKSDDDVEQTIPKPVKEYSNTGHFVTDDSKLENDTDQDSDIVNYLADISLSKHTPVDSSEQHSDLVSSIISIPVNDLVQAADGCLALSNSFSRSSESQHLSGPSSPGSQLSNSAASIVLANQIGSTSAVKPINIDDPELVFPFEIGRVAQCRRCGCCYHLKCFKDAQERCPKCERIQQRKAKIVSSSMRDSDFISTPQKHNDDNRT